MPAVKVWITGEVGLEDDELVGMSSGTFNASIFSVVLVLLILLVAYRSILLTVATLITLALGMVFCGAFAAFSVKELEFNFGCFCRIQYRFGRGICHSFLFALPGQSAASCSQESSHTQYLISTSPSLLLCAGTTSIGLYAFIPTDYKGVSELGLLAGTSLFICLVSDLDGFACTVKIHPCAGKVPSAIRPPALATLSEKLATFTLHYAKPISIATLPYRRHIRSARF